MIERLRDTDGMLLQVSELYRQLRKGINHVDEGNYAEALPVLEGAVRVAERFDVHGPVDPETRFIAIEAVGFCYFKLGRLDEALHWYERAVAEAGQRVNTAKCLDMVAICHAGLGKDAAALPWFERAVAARENGTAEPAELGASLHNVADCLVKLGRYAEALAWFERAVAAKQRPNVDGHVDTDGIQLSLLQAARCRARLAEIADAPAYRTAEPRSMGGAEDPACIAATATFPLEWRQILLDQVPFYRGLRRTERQRFEDKLKAFVDTKTFSSKQVEITEEVKVIVAAAACRLTMNQPWEDYARLRHVSVHAHDVAHDGGSRVTGRADRSKVTVSWAELIRGFAEPGDGDNVGFHEFAHALDGADGSMDGEAQAPPTETYQDWRHVIASARAEVRRALAASMNPPIDAYAAESDAEFFAVATEWFFERPLDLRTRLPEVYYLLHRFYRQDPAGDDTSP